MPEKPLLIYDGQCGFCRTWIDYYRSLTGSAVDYPPSQEVTETFPQISEESFRRSVQMVLPDGRVLSGAAAAFSTLGYAGVHWPMWLYRHVPGFGATSEFAYRFIAARREGVAVASWCEVPIRFALTEAQAN